MIISHPQKLEAFELHMPAEIVSRKLVSRVSDARIQGRGVRQKNVREDRCPSPRTKWIFFVVQTGMYRGQIVNSL
jgi:hypothetical protein